MDSQRISADELLVHAAGLRRLAVRLVGDGADADDLVQQALVAGLEHPPTRTQPLAAWLARVMKNFATQRWRGESNRARREMLAARSEAEPSEAEMIERLELHRVVVEEVLALPDPYRRAILSLYFDNVRPDEHAKSLGVAAGTVRSQVSRGIEMLRERLDARSNGDRSAWMTGLIAFARTEPQAATGAWLASGGWFIAKTLVVLVLASGTFAVLLRAACVSPRPTNNALAKPTGGTQTASVVSPAEKSSGARDAVPPRAETPVGLDQANVATLEVHVIASETGKSRGGVRLRLTPRGGGSSGLDIDGSHANHGESPLSGADGVATFTIPSSPPSTLWVNDANAPHGRVNIDIEPLDVGQRRVVQVSIPTRLDIHFFGRVVDADSEAPIAGARVRSESDEPLWSSPEPSESSHRELSTSNDGVFDVWGASWWRVELAIDAPGLASAVAKTEPSHETPERAEVIQLRRGARLDVALHDTRMRAFDGLRIKASCKAYQLAQAGHGDEFLGDDAKEWFANCASDGRASLDRMPPSVPLSITIERDNAKLLSLPQPVTLTPGEQRTITVELHPDALIRGRLLDDADRPIAASVVWLEPGESDFAAEVLRSGDPPTQVAATNDDGRFQFTEIPDGHWRVGPAADEDTQAMTENANALSGLAESATIDSTHRSVELTLRASRGLYISGRVVQPDGVALDDVPIFADRVSDHVEFVAQSSNSGQFRVGPLLRGAYRLRAWGSDAFAESKALTVEAGARNVELRLTIGGHLVGTVVDGAGQLTPAELWAAPSSSETASFLLTGASSPDGRFSFNVLPGGGYEVFASTADGRFGTTHVELAASAVPTQCTVELKPAAKLVLRNDGAAHWQFVTLKQGSLRLPSDNVERGTEDTFVVPAGQITIESTPRVGDAPETSTVEVAAGETKRIVIGKTN